MHPIPPGRSEGKPGRLEGKVAVVTGASRGIGEAIAHALVTEGARVVLTARKPDALHAVAAKLEAIRPGSALAMPCHNGDLAAIDRLWTTLDEAVGPVNVLVNNAAANPYLGPMVGLDWGAWDKTFEVNLKGPFAHTRELVRRATADARPAAVVNISSVFGLSGAPLQGVYGMTKAALVSMTRTLAVELGAAGIRVNAIAPGLVDTRFAAAIVHTPELSRRFTERAPLGRAAVPGEIAPLAVYLASDEAGYVTGQVFTIDGGYTAL